MKESTKIWRKTNRRRFKSTAEFNRWQADRKRKWRAKNPNKYKAALIKHRTYMAKYNNKLLDRKRDAIVWEFICKIATRIKTRRSRDKRDIFYKMDQQPK